MWPRAQPLLAEASSSPIYRSPPECDAVLSNFVRELPWRISYTIAQAPWSAHLLDQKSLNRVPRIDTSYERRRYQISDPWRWFNGDSVHWTCTWAGEKVVLVGFLDAGANATRCKMWLQGSKLSTVSGYNTVAAGSLIVGKDAPSLILKTETQRALWDLSTVPWTNIESNVQVEGLDSLVQWAQCWLDDFSIQRLNLVVGVISDAFARSFWWSRVTLSMAKKCMHICTCCTVHTCFRSKFQRNRQRGEARKAETFM